MGKANYLSSNQNIKGFGLIEIMVGMVIGLITVVVIMQVFAAAEGYKRTTTAGTDSQTNGMLALRTLESEIRMAGYGMTNSAGMLCPKMNTYYNGAVTLNVNQMPVKIIDGGASGASDSIEMMYSTSASGSSPMCITNSMPLPANVTRVNNAGALKQCSFFAYATKDGSKSCTLAQVTDNNLVTSDTQIHTASGNSNSLFNPPGGFNDTLFPTGGYSSAPGGGCGGDIIIDLGNKATWRYAVNKTTGKDEYFLRRINQTPADGCGGSPPPDLDLVSNVVNIQAQYGVAPAASQTVDCWTNASATSTGCSITSGSNWSDPPVADIKRIKAVRVAVVVRSALSEKPSSGGTCDTTTSAPVSWNGGPAIDLSTVPNWQCYRYKVYQSVVPIINVLWANT